MSTLYPVAGSRIFIGPAKDVPDEDVDATDFTGITWTEIRGWQTMGAVGDAAALITESIISYGRDIKMKGTRNAGSMSNNFVIMPTDAGQLALIAAEATDYNYPFRITFDDEPASGSAPTPTMKYFIGLVTTAQEQGGGANTARLLNGTIEINTNVLTVPAAAGA